MHRPPTTSRPHRAAAAIALAALWCLAPSASGQPLPRPLGAVATGHPLATRTAADILRDGGNAIDAAVAAALTLGVVDGHNSGIGGGCFILIRAADEQVLAIDGRETAPAAATPDMFVKDGRADVSLSQTGPLASGTPGALAAYRLALDEAGTLPLSDLLKPGIALAEDGFPVNATYVARMATVALTMAREKSSRALMLDEQGRPLVPGSILRQPDLAETYRAIARHGTDYFYRGQFAQRVGQWMKDNGGILTARDFANYQPVLREPIRSSYRGHTILGFPPPSSGGIHVSQILQMTESFAPKQLTKGRHMWIHAVAEAMKLAFADRAHWLGDSDFADVPAGLTDPAYNRRLAERIDPEKVTPVEGHSTPADADTNFIDGHTTHLSVADADGNWVAITATVNTAFGAKVVIPETGVIMNNQMDDFSVEPGVPNHFGLIGSTANQVEPGKRPLSSMSPSIILDPGDRPWLSIGAAGGPTIISQVALALVRLVDFDQSLDEAVAAPRFHHQWRPDRLRIESSWPDKVSREMEGCGHKVRVGPPIGRSQAVMMDNQSRFHAATDPRGEGRAEVVGPTPDPSP